MTCFSVWLAAVGLADMVRGTSEATPWRRSTLAVLVGTVAAALVLSLAGVPTGEVLLLSVGYVTGLALWICLSTGAMTTRWSTAWPLGLMAGTFLLLLGMTGVTPSAGGVLKQWYYDLSVTFLAGVPLERFLAGAGALLYLQVTTNVLVRLVLLGAGTPASKGEDTLRGGRLLGPMERTFVFGLGLAGELTAAAVIVAAKGILRFPEIRAAETPGGPDLVTEYFLIGTLASWLAALALLAIV